MRINLLDLTYQEFEALMTTALDEPAFRAKRVWHWLWRKAVIDFSVMHDVAASARYKLAEACCIALPEVVDQQQAADGTRKFLLRFADGAMVETVLIPGEVRHGVVRQTQCLSCQVGCAMGCTFCSTGSLGFTRNLTAGEILSQVLAARQIIGDHTPPTPMIRNLVYMGMGEPLLNIDNVLRSLEILHDSHGPNFSARRLTVSTCGLPNGLQKLGDSGLAFIALSLHAPTQELRARLMPRAARWPLDAMLAALQQYPLKTREKLTLEYLLLGSVNDGAVHAVALAEVVRQVNGKLNLIIFNPAPGLPYVTPGRRAVDDFCAVLRNMGVTAIVRKSKGQDIAAACGQLRSGGLPV